MNISYLFRPCLGYVPDGVSVMDCLRKFIQQMKVLQQGYKVWSEHHKKEVVLFGRLFMNIADFPAAQQMSGSRGILHNHIYKILSLSLTSKNVV